MVQPSQCRFSAITTRRAPRIFAHHTHTLRTASIMFRHNTLTHTAQIHVIASRWWLLWHLSSKRGMYLVIRAPMLDASDSTDRFLLNRKSWASQVVLILNESREQPAFCRRRTANSQPPLCWRGCRESRGLTELCCCREWMYENTIYITKITSWQMRCVRFTVVRGGLALQYASIETHQMFGHLICVWFLLSNQVCTGINKLYQDIYDDHLLVINGMECFIRFAAVSYSS